MRVTLRRKRKRADTKASISYQAKDIIQKILVDRLGNEALAWYGLELPAINGPLPSVWSILTIEKREVDSVYRLADGTILDVEFQSDSVGQKDLERFLRDATILATHYTPRSRWSWSIYERTRLQPAWIWGRSLCI